jgi:serine/threonine protein kinase
MINVGQTIGNYRITAKLGEGGMGVVYLAEHPVIGKKVAMKAIHPQLSRNAEVVSRFMTEAKSVNQIGHEHIVDISDFGNTPDGEFYFVMEFLQGQAMAERLKQDGHMPWRQALSIAAQVADALDASHQHGIIHRDLKPENIYLIPRGANKDFVKVLDFGLAKLTQSDEKVTHKTRTGSLMGTPYYMAPEQCEGRTAIDYRADIYSLGVILFEMLTGKVPFGGEGYGEIIVKHITMPPPSARELIPEIPRAVDLILLRALAKDRDLRFQSMADFQAAMLDPEGYAAKTPTLGAASQASPGTAARASQPMSQSELQRAASPLDRFGSGSVATAQTIIGSSSHPSTFRHGVGEVLDELPARRSGRKLLVLLAGAAALAAGAVVVVRATRGAAPPAPAAPPLAAERAPASVRVNFNSEPKGATVVRADTGSELGRTPLSIEVPYSDAAVEFVLKEAGYENKVVSIVPNLPSPLFATLQPLPRPEVKAEPGAEPAPASVTASAAAGPHKARKRPAARPQQVDDDAVLEPSFK